MKAFLWFCALFLGGISWAPAAVDCVSVSISAFHRRNGALNPLRGEEEDGEDVSQAEASESSGPGNVKSTHSGGAKYRKSTAGKEAHAEANLQGQEKQWEVDGEVSMEGDGTADSNDPTIEQPKALKAEDGREEANMEASLEHDPTIEEPAPLRAKDNDDQNEDENDDKDKDKETTEKPDDMKASASSFLTLHMDDASVREGVDKEDEEAILGAGVDSAEENLMEVTVEAMRRRRNTLLMSAWDELNTNNDKGEGGGTQGSDGKGDSKESTVSYVTYVGMHGFTDCKNTRRKKPKDMWGNTYPKQCFEGTHTQRFKHFSTLLKTASEMAKQNRKKQAFGKNCDSHNPSCLHVLAMPEWYFRRQSKHYTKPQMMDLVNMLKKTSSKPEYTNWLIAPGTIYWGLHDQEAGYKPYTYIFNCAPVLYNGQLISFHCKHGNDDHLDPDEKWGPDGKQISSSVETELTGDHFLDQNLFKIGKRNCGLDICVDHLNNPDKKNIQKAHENFDIMLLIAAGMHFHPQKVSVHKNGVILRSDGAVAKPDAGAQLFVNGRDICNTRQVYQESNRTDDPFKHGYSECEPLAQSGNSITDAGLTNYANKLYLFPTVPLQYVTQAPNPAIPEIAPSLLIPKQQLKTAAAAAVVGGGGGGGAATSKNNNYNTDNGNDKMNMNDNSNLNNNYNNDDNMNMNHNDDNGSGPNYSSYNTPSNSNSNTIRNSNSISNRNSISNSISNSNNQAALGGDYNLEDKPLKYLGPTSADIEQK